MIRIERINEKEVLIEEELHIYGKIRYKTAIRKYKDGVIKYNHKVYNKEIEVGKIVWAS